MRLYLDHALKFDLALALICLAISYFSRGWVIINFNAPAASDIQEFSGVLITVGSTLIGFLLTIVTVIVTFKASFDSHQKPVLNESDGTIFDKQITKDQQFYGTFIHKKVMKVFINATYEMGLVILVLLTLYMNTFQFDLFWMVYFNLAAFITITLAVVRSFYIFKLFLNVHIEA